MPRKLTGITRRHFAAGSLALLAARPAFALPRDVDYALQQDFGRITPAEGAIHLDLPDFTDAGTTVPITFSVDSPMTEDDYIRRVVIYGSRNPRPRLLTVQFHPLGGVAEFSTRLRLEGAQTITALAESSGGEYWRKDQHVGVTFGACATVGEGDGLPADWEPSIRVSVPPTATAGEPVEIRTLISHPMETGLRLNRANQYVPLRIIERFTCRVNGQIAIEALLEPAISTNPYLAFPLIARESATLDFEWLDTTGALYTETAELVVS